MSAETAFQGALNSALVAAGLRVYDAAPQNPVWPYVEIGFAIFSEKDTMRETGFSILARIHTRSQSTSMKETKDIQGVIYGALHRQALPVAGYTTILVRREISNVLRAPDNSFHGVCEYRALLSN